MPKKRMLKLGRKSGKYTLSEEVYVLQVYVADIPLIQCTLRTDSTGSQCMLYVRDKLDLRQWELFSFRFQQRLPDPDRRLWRWVEMDRPLRKQLDKWACRPRQVQLAILYHTPNVFSLSDQTARSLYYALLKQDVLQAKFSGMELEKYMSLAALSLQVDHPNYDPQLHTTEWLRAQRLLPTSIVAGQPQMLDEFIARIVEFYARLSGMNPTYAAFLYIVDVQQCDGYGDEHWPARDDEGMEVRLGYTLDDVYALRPATGARVGIPWVGVRSVQVSKRVLRVRTTSGGVASNYAYTLENVEMAKYVAMVLDWQWRFATVDAAVHRAVPMSINNLKGSIRTFNGAAYHPRHTGTNSAGGAGSRATNSFDMAAAGQSSSQSTTTHTTSNTHHQQIPFYQPMQPVRFQEPNASEVTRSMLNVNGAVSSIASGSITQLHVSNPQLHLINGKKLMHSPICRPSSASSTSQQRPAAVSLCSQGPTPAHLQESQKEILKLMLAEKQRLDELERSGGNGGRRLAAGSSPEIHMVGVAGSGGKLSYLMKKVSSPHFLRTPKIVDSAKRVDYTGAVAPQSQSTRMDECGGGPARDASDAANGDCSANMKWRSTPELYSNQLQVLAPNTIVATPFIATAAAKRKPNRRQRYARHTAEVHPMMMAAAAAAVEYKQEQQNCPKLAASLSHPHGRLTKQKSISQASSPASSQETDSPPNGNALNDGGPLRDGLPVEITAQGLDGRPSFRFPTPPHSPPPPPNYSMGQMITQSGAVRPVNYPLPKSALKQHNGSQQPMHPPSSPPPPPPLLLSPPNCGSNSRSTRVDLHQCQKEPSADGMLRYAIKPPNGLHASENHYSTRNVLLNGVVAAGATNANGALKSQLSPPYSRGGGNLGKQERGEESSSMLKLLQEKLGVPGAVEMEFDGVPAKRLSAGFSTSQLPENQHRNRECASSRRVIYPYEDTRVMLHSHKNNPNGYINASNVQWPIDYGSSPSNGGVGGGGAGPVLKYIVSQAPMRHTIKDFWQMVWESGARIIVMLVNPHQLEKADTIPHYWPAGAEGNEEEKLQLDGAGYFVLRLKSATKTAFQTTSVLSLKSLARGERRTIYHLQCADFTAEGVPSSQDTFMGFIDAVTSVKRIVENESIARGEKEAVTLRKRPSLVHQQSSNASSNTTNSSSSSANAANSHVKMTLNGRKRARRSRSIGRSNLSDLSDRIREVTSASHQSLVESGAALMKRLSIGNQSSISVGSHNSVSVNGNSGTPNSTFYTNPNAATTAPTTPSNRRTAASMVAREPAEEPLTIVHCTDGASESGVFVLMEVLIRCIENNEVVDIAQVLRALRQQRMCLVKNSGQYRFVHELIVGLLERSRLI